MAALGDRLREYYKAIERQTLEIQKGECDFLIESSEDSLVRQFVALDIFRHFLDSPMMGSETVAVHVFDKWLADRKIRMKSEADYMAAKVFAEFNRRSLIGAEAPTLILETFDGTQLELYGSNPGNRFSVLYFYDTDCAKCKVETIYLKNLFNVRDYPVDVYAVYTGDDRQAWSSYIAERLVMDSSKVTHLWDPSIESDFQRKYGVVQTPRLFLIGPDGTILGRGLDVRSLEKMLDGIFTEKKLEYGSRESESLFDGIFASSGGRPGANEVKGIADYIHDRTLSKKDTVMFRQLAGDYLYYLSSRAGEGFKEGLKYHLGKNILSRGDVWKTSDDSLKVIGFASIMNDLLSKAAVGTRVPHIRLKAELYASGKIKEKKVYLDRLKGKENVIIFYTEGCDVCAAEKAAAVKLAEGSYKVNVLMVNFDNIMESDPSLASHLMDSFDLSSLPYIIMTDSDGTILRRYMSLQ
jgi:alkyl hydroperoxide reductase subunit AhpC